MGDSVNELGEDVLELVRQFQALEYFRVIIVTLFFYDYLMSLEKEISSIWVGKWTTLNILYLLTRYIPFITFLDVVWTLLIDFDPKMCKPMFHFSLWTSMSGIAIAEACFCLRAYALWGASRGVAIFLGSLFSAMVTSGFIINGFMAASSTMAQPSLNLPRLIPRCILHLGHGNLAICGWIIIAVVDTTLISMIIYAKSCMYRSFTTTQNVLLNHIYRDALVYFFCNFCISITSVLLFLVTPGPIKAASSFFGLAMFSILSCKVLLRLRDFGNSHTLNQDISSLDSNMVLSSLRFNRRVTDVHISHSSECP